MGVFPLIVVAFGGRGGDTRAFDELGVLVACSVAFVDDVEFPPAVCPPKVCPSMACPPTACPPTACPVGRIRRRYGCKTGVGTPVVPVVDDWLEVETNDDEDEEDDKDDEDEEDDKDDEDDEDDGENEAVVLI